MGAGKSFNLDYYLPSITSIEPDAMPPINYDGRAVTLALDQSTRLSNFTFNSVSDSGRHAISKSGQVYSCETNRVQIGLRFQQRLSSGERDDR